MGTIHDISDRPAAIWRTPRHYTGSQHPASGSRTPIRPARYASRLPDGLLGQCEYDGSIPDGHSICGTPPIRRAIGKMHYRGVEDPLGYDRQHEPMHIMDGIGMVWGAIRNPFPN